MLIETPMYTIELVTPSDYEAILAVFNSNIAFLRSHLGKTQIDRTWLISELQSMQVAHFQSCAVKAKPSRQVVGYLDFKIDEPTYLSLFIIHGNFHGQGIGTKVYQAFEQFIFAQSSGIRIDVVTEYDDSILKFWKNQGFHEIKNIVLNWNEKVLPAIIMKKRADRAYEPIHLSSL